MSVTHFINLHCDQPGCDTVIWTDRVDLHDARADAARFGWGFDGQSESDFCRVHRPAAAVRGAKP